MCRWTTSSPGRITRKGKSYDFHPQHDPQHEELRRFLDMCFEPGTPANAKLKDSLYRMMEEQK